MHVHAYGTYFIDFQYGILQLPLSLIGNLLFLFPKCHFCEITDSCNVQIVHCHLTVVIVPHLSTVLPDIFERTKAHTHHPGLRRGRVHPAEVANQRAVHPVCQVDGREGKFRKEDVTGLVRGS